MIRKMMEH